MTPKQILNAAMLNVPGLARLSGVSVDAVRAILYGKRDPRPATRQKLADALRRHADNLRTLADQLQP